MNRILVITDTALDACNAYDHEHGVESLQIPCNDWNLKYDDGLPRPVKAVFNVDDEGEVSIIRLTIRHPEAITDDSILADIDIYPLMSETMQDHIAELISVDWSGIERRARESRKDEAAEV